MVSSRGPPPRPGVGISRGQIHLAISDGRRENITVAARIGARRVRVGGGLLADENNANTSGGMADQPSAIPPLYAMRDDPSFPKDASTENLSGGKAIEEPDNAAGEWSRPRAGAG